MPAFPSLDGATTEDECATMEMEPGDCFAGVGEIRSTLGVAGLRAERLLDGAGGCREMGDLSSRAAAGGVLGVFLVTWAVVIVQRSREKATRVDKEGGRT